MWSSNKKDGSREKDNSRSKEKYWRKADVEKNR